MHVFKHLQKIKIYGAFLFFLYPCSTISEENGRQSQKIKHKKDWSLKDHLKKFEPSSVLERIEKLRTAAKGKFTDSMYVENMLNGIDEADYLLNLRVPNYSASGRKQSKHDNPYAFIFPTDIPKDVFNLRPRLMALMQTAIYQARDAMGIMQIMREKYTYQGDSRFKLYKMGFLMCKTDNTVKTYSKFAFRAYKLCLLGRTRQMHRLTLYDALLTHERLLHLLFHAQLLTDVVIKNDESCRKTLDEYNNERLEHWKFED